MNKWNDFSDWKVILLIAAALLLFLIFPLAYHQYQQNLNDHNHHQGNEEPKNGDAKDNENKVPDTIWGVDSASKTTNEMYKCVKDNYGKPEVWGRYTETTEGVSTGLSKAEVKFLHDKDVKILLIYNHFSEATSKNNGIKEAETAIKFAKDIAAPKGTAIFADIEPKYPVNSAFIQGWFETIEKSDYHPGIYGVFDKDQKLFEAFNKAAKENKDIKDKTLIWTATPNKGITSKDKAPKYNPTGPKDSLLYGWQYGLDAKTCNIDTNLFKGEIIEYLW